MINANKKQKIEDRFLHIDVNNVIMIDVSIVILSKFEKNIYMKYYIKIFKSNMKKF